MVGCLDWLVVCLVGCSVDYSSWLVVRMVHWLDKLSIAVTLMVHNIRGVRRLMKPPINPEDDNEPRPLELNHTFDRLEILCERSTNVSDVDLK